MNSDGFESGWREDIQMLNSTIRLEKLCRNGWIIIEILLLLSRALWNDRFRRSFESGRIEGDSFSGKIWFCQKRIFIYIISIVYM